MKAHFPGTFTAGSVWVQPHSAGKGAATYPIRLLSGLTVLYSLAFYHGQLYVAEEGRVTVMRSAVTRHRMSEGRTLISNLPTGGRHVSRTIAFGPDGMFYVSIGSSCDPCIESDSRRASIMRYRSNGTSGQVYAHGLRNAVDLAWQPLKGELWATDKGRRTTGRIT